MKIEIKVKVKEGYMARVKSYIVEDHNWQTPAFFIWRSRKVVCSSGLSTGFGQVNPSNLESRQV